MVLKNFWICGVKCFQKFLCVCTKKQYLKTEMFWLQIREKQGQKGEEEIFRIQDFHALCKRVEAQSFCFYSGKLDSDNGLNEMSFSTTFSNNEDLGESSLEIRRLRFSLPLLLSWITPSPFPSLPRGQSWNETRKVYTFFRRRVRDDLLQIFRGFIHVKLHPKIFIQNQRMVST